MQGYVIGIIVGCIVLFLLICARLLWKLLRNRQSTDSAPHQRPVDPERPPVSTHSSNLQRRDSIRSGPQHDIERSSTSYSSNRQQRSERPPVPTPTSSLRRKDSFRYGPQHDIERLPAPSSSRIHQHKPSVPCHVFTTSESDRATTVQPYDLYGTVKPLDLHGLPVALAIEQTRQYLKLYSSTFAHLEIITGRGIHSPGGIPKIKPAIERLLTEKGYDYREINKGGALIVSC